jgi:hypothetical protein
MITLLDHGRFGVMDFRLRMQLAEAHGSVNRWYCSQAYGRHVNDPELLLVYFIKSGGAEDFANRFEQAMGAMNRWYCSEFYGREIRDAEILWDYYMNYSEDRCNQNAGLDESDNEPADISIAC